MLFDFWVEHWVVYIVIFVLISIIYNKVFRVRKLPVLQTAVVYVLIAIGTYVLMVFQADAGLPIWQSLSVAVAMMVLYRIRMIMLSIQNKSKSNSKEENGQ